MSDVKQIGPVVKRIRGVVTQLINKGVPRAVIVVALECIANALRGEVKEFYDEKEKTR